MNINQTLRFILPLICNRSPFFYLNKEFIGCYIGDSDKPLLDGKLLMIYNYPLTIKFSKFESLLMETPGFISDYEYVKENEDLITIYIFSLKEYEKEIEKIIDGKYSELLPESKLKITKFWKTYSDTTLMPTIFNNPSDMIFYWKKRDLNPEDYCYPGEVWYKPDIKEEIYSLKE